MRDYYLILGVPRTESPRGIRSAYRDLAKRLHPDRSGPEERRRFEEVTEAYRTLVDPALRDRYDRRLRNAEAGGTLSRRRFEGVAPEPLRPEPLYRTRQPEPLIPEPLAGEPISPFDDFEIVRPSVEALWDRVRRNFTHLHEPKGEHAEALTLEVPLRPDQAARGGRLPLTLPWFRVCPNCAGAGSDWGFRCEVCGGEGQILGRATIDVRVPAHAPDGLRIERSLSELGVDNLYLRVLIRVDPTW